MRARKLWTIEEDQVLRQAANTQVTTGGAVKDWNRIARQLEDRTNKDCRKRWSKISKVVNRGAWSAEENSRLLQATKLFGLRWTKIAEYVATRHADQCAKRWVHGLSDEQKADFTEGASFEDYSLSTTPGTGNNSEDSEDPADLTEDDTIAFRLNENSFYDQEVDSALWIATSDYCNAAASQVAIQEDSPPRITDMTMTDDSSIFYPQAMNARFPSHAAYMQGHRPCDHHHFHAPDQLPSPTEAFSPDNQSILVDMTSLYDSSDVGALPPSDICYHNIQPEFQGSYFPSPSIPPNQGKTVLEMENLPLSALSRIMDIAFQNRSNVKLRWASDER
ncbi:hypothetical protein LTS08_005446 [Lithohypha guttulata]|uniref:Uncharacterized protein n=1 Tax=Lithohypha guttulata TaxID=1690604 RepID=A0AAN7T2L1_9EURO|nr:hypothetical protein LTR51_003375 [Lithohypha guttulata]KAK5087198.1 hypothetical protein LTR05_004369 [Lithohypha guttulata]KAK5099731.1 hypothetical protein LTS08_005446 [Lithohypha guttulata]